MRVLDYCDRLVENVATLPVSLCTESSLIENLVKQGIITCNAFLRLTTLKGIIDIKTGEINSCTH
jgi:hypothetical protein